jgi:hypothetical protein
VICITLKKIYNKKEPAMVDFDSNKCKCILASSCCCTVLFIILAAMSFSTIEPLEWGLKYSSFSKSIVLEAGSDRAKSNPGVLTPSDDQRPILDLAAEQVRKVPEDAADDRVLGPPWCERVAS